MDDLAAQINMFPSVNATPIGNIDGLRIPVGTERPGGQRIRWKGPVCRVELSELRIVIPPVRMAANNTDSPKFNVDRESSPYPINNGNGRTTREIHFGVEHDFILRVNRSLRIGRIDLVMDSVQYATILTALQDSIRLHGL